MHKAITPNEARRIKVGTDIGGTFTDFVAIDESSGKIWLEKTLTTPKDPSEGVFNGLARFEHQAGLSLREYETLVHGTTLVINALIERKGEKTALITTAGFRDILEMRDELRYDVYDLQIEFPAPLIPRKYRYEIEERVSADGRLLKAIKKQEVLKLISAIREAEIRTVAICLLNSYANNENERTLAALLRTEAPEMAVTASHEVLPQVGEYKRTSTTAANAYVKPLIASYLDRLDDGLRQKGFNGDLFIMQSGGGVFGKTAAKSLPVRILESGPAGGVAAAKWWGQLTGISELLAFDMGGTTAKLCTIAGGEALVTDEYEAARLYHFKPGSGLAINVPVLDLLEIGTGGGSIAHIDSLGLLKVGPDSAGASPGPVCYGLGGDKPSVTDANVALGYLDPDSFLGGEMKLDRAKAMRVIDETIGAPLGSDHAFEAAYRIHDIANEDMAAAAKLYLAERGKDPKQLTMVAYGGAGPGHAHALAEKLGIRTVLIPPAAGVMSALGMLVEKLSTEQVKSYQKLLTDVTADELNTALQAMKEEAASILNTASDKLDYRASIGLRFKGQGYQIKLILNDLDKTDQALRSEIASRFKNAYEHTYGRAYSDVAIETSTLRIVAQSGGARPMMPTMFTEKSGQQCSPRIYREAYFGLQSGTINCPVFDRAELSSGMRYQGPAFIEERETTIVVRPNSTFEITEFGVLVINLDNTNQGWGNERQKA